MLKGKESFEQLENAVAELSSLLIARTDGKTASSKKKEVQFSERQRSVIKHLFGESFVKSMDKFKARAAHLEDENSCLLLQIKDETTKSEELYALVLKYSSLV